MIAFKNESNGINGESLPNLTFILGGARSGKSSLAEARAREYGDNVIYCATAEILDEELKDRVT